MSEDDDSIKSEPISADALFMETFPVHPMVAFFIALPLKERAPDAEIYLLNRGANAYMRSGVHYHQETGKSTFLGFPGGVVGRRIFMYFFWLYYRDPSAFFIHGDNIKEDINEFGYHSKSGRLGHPVRQGLMKFVYIKARFILPENNIRVGFTGIDQYCDIMVAYKWVDRKYTVIMPNQRYLFRMGFPIDFDRVKSIRKKCEFWNVYMFLIDVLPRIEKGTKTRISWELMHDVFVRRYTTIENFRYFFRKQVKAVLEIYPQAKSKVDTSHNGELILGYAPPPINPEPFDNLEPESKVIEKFRSKRNSK